MTLRGILEDFDNCQAKARTTSHPQMSSGHDDADAIKSKAYEVGYASGWEDATRAAEDGRIKMDAELTRNIQDLGFTFHEAVSHVRVEIADLVDQMLKSFFPDILPKILREIVVLGLQPMVDEILEPSVQIVTSSESYATISGLLDGDHPFEIELVEEQTLAPYQVFMRFGEQEVAWDFTPLLKALHQQIAAMSELRTESAQSE